MFNYDSNKFEYSKMTRISIEVTEQEKQKIKVLAAMHNLTMKDFILERTIRDSVPNEETLEAFAEVESNKGLQSYATVDDMMSDILGDDAEDFSDE